ncbi:MAG: phosphoribosylanthranilate isomerase [Rhodospirillaceae bacterium]|nr:phosphoribosylanthranilate isomerase [Rhodospirillaceae bacterium]|tara:strand:- start:30685 stop:31335 length:651 start_codon:yes stop_codon:yes gene_type:complete
MSVQAKICGINAPGAMEAAIDGGAAFVGLVFYPPSPRAVTTNEAAALSAMVPETVQRVGLFVDVDDETLNDILSRVPLDLLQLHGKESTERVVAIKEATGLPVMKAIHIESASDFRAIEKYASIADQILFDAKAPKDMKDALPGGNALSFDWSLFADHPWQDNWMLSGGLNIDNVEEAVRITGAQSVDVSSGVEISPGEKSTSSIKLFLETVLALP